MNIIDFYNDEKEFFTVSEFISLLNSKIQGMQTAVVGEVSELKQSAKGHVYPVIKDKETGDILPATVWANDYVLNGIELEIGMEIAAKGFPQYYGPFGKLSFHISSFELVGEGQLKKAYEKLKEKLSKEGIFDEKNKKTLPKFPQKIGIITSTRGEVIHDFSNNLRKSGFNVKILHCPVEGADSGRHLTLSVRYFKEENIDVLVIMRGGGSIQSLAGFDNEALVREIYSFPKPVIAGVGHHQDITLTSLASDYAESTPSMVASLLNRGWEEANYELKRSNQRIMESFKKSIHTKSDSLINSLSKNRDFLKDVFNRYRDNKKIILNAINRVEEKTLNTKKEINRTALLLTRNMTQFIKDSGYQSLKNSSNKILNRYSERLRDTEEKKENLQRVISSSDPKRHLKLGYSIVKSGERIVKTKKELKKDQELSILVSDGKIISQIKKII